MVDGMHVYVNGTCMKGCKGQDLFQLVASHLKMAPHYVCIFAKVEPKLMYIPSATLRENVRLYPPWCRLPFDILLERSPTFEANHRLINCYFTARIVVACKEGGEDVKKWFDPGPFWC